MRNTLAAKHSSIDSVDDSIIMKRAKIGNPQYFVLPLSFNLSMQLHSYP